MTRQAVLMSVIGSSHVLLAWCIDVPHSFLSTYLVIGSMDETSCKKKQRNEAEIALQHRRWGANENTSPRR
ncbi:hypothetical protein BC827DRAFT_1220094 [Russula dissimulans]|nr:hypothetical protein BC827DRAFT_110308 [Russula dissimulans]KAH9958500.1 hypothetical protein BC827DRAFT_1220094 [Russula dissimulans]